jgi:hypothetical protein
MAGKIMRSEIGFRFRHDQRVVSPANAADERLAEKFPRDLVRGPVEECSWEHGVCAAWLALTARFVGCWAGHAVRYPSKYP